MFSEVFFTGLYSSLIGFLIAIGAQCYKSKCKEVKICCITIKRDVAGEEELDRQPQNPIQSNNNLKFEIYF
jgi:hypothetical protein